MSNQMTVAEAKRKQRELEKAINALVNEFAKETGVIVTGLSVSRLVTGDPEMPVYEKTLAHDVAVHTSL